MLSALYGGAGVRPNFAMNTLPEHLPQPGSPAWWRTRPLRVEKSGGRGRPTLSFERIIAVALETVDEVGPQAFNMRLLAERLESGTATLYRHVASKDEILAYVVDRVLGELDTTAVDAASTRWQQACMCHGERVFALLRKHPGIVPLLVAQVPLGPNGLKVRESGIATFLANGFAADLAARAYTTVAHYVLGFAMQHPGAAENEPHGEDIINFFAGLDAGQYPAIAAAGQHLPGESVEDEFRFGLKLIIDGLGLALACEL